MKLIECHFENLWIMKNKWNSLSKEGVGPKGKGFGSDHVPIIVHLIIVKC